MALFIKLFELLDGVGRGDFGATCRPVGEEKFAKLSAPIPEVIDADDPMAKPFKVLSSRPPEPRAAWSIRFKLKQLKAKVA